MDPELRYRQVCGGVLGCGARGVQRGMKWTVQVVSIMKSTTDIRVEGFNDDENPAVPYVSCFCEISQGNSWCITIRVVPIMRFSRQMMSSHEMSDPHEAIGSMTRCLLKPENTP